MRSFLLPLLVAVPTAAVAHDYAPITLVVRSSAFGDGEPIPAEYTCDGQNASPPLSWSRVPVATKSIAILVDDPDAPKGTFTHWLVTGVPPTTTSLDKGARLPAGAHAMKNDSGTTGYTGPCPPSGRHRYELRVYALDVPSVNATNRAELASAIKGHVLATGELVGTYERAPR
jgi:Raf kinase inhibitor-like YbhB/YbcL family protein